MNEDAKQMREFCQKRLIELYSTNPPLTEKQTNDNIKILVDLMHKRLTILEGADLRSLEDITL